MIVINTSPAIHLHVALPGGLTTLPEWYGDVIMPQEVFAELAAGSAKDDTARALEAKTGIIIRERPIKLSAWVRDELDLGEAAVIQTALDEGHSTVILDDMKGRRIARRLGLNVTGTLGILVQAKLVGQLPEIKPIITQLVGRGMWIDEALRDAALRAAGEGL